MADTLLLELTWENEVGFTLKSKMNADPIKTIVNVDENGHLATLWTHIQAACEVYVKEELNAIGTLMKA